MGSWADKLRRSVTVKSKKQDDCKLSVRRLCRDIGMSERIYRQVAAGENGNLHNYLRVVFRCISLHPAARQQELLLALAAKLREEVMNE
ncbi:MAG: hypothetical protein IJX44_08850 [Bacteroidaceae bacterium]|nr:hypothetical protein [Bacteroidaceae bacterium]